MTTSITTKYTPTTIEPGGIEPIPANKRHGRPWQLFATWAAPNLEFATIFVGILAVGVFGLSFWQAVAAIVLGNLLGGITHGVLSSWGPRDGLAQMVLGRTAFGIRGNILPAGLNTLMAGLGWFAVNSVSGAWAISTLTGLPTWLSLLIVVVVEVFVAFVGHDLVQIFERYATFILGAIFLVAGVIILSQSNPGASAPSTAFVSGGFAGFTLAATAAFGYTAGWNPYASDYTRYLPVKTKPTTVGLAAGLGNFVSTTFLMIVGAASVSIVSALGDKATPTDVFTQHLGPVGGITLLAIAIGAVAANVLNIYSGAMSFLAAGVKLNFKLRRAIVALVFGVIGFVVALFALPDAAHSYENFLLVISYWIAPWLGVVLTDRLLRRGTAVAPLTTNEAKYGNLAGLIAFVVGVVASIWLFSNQAFYTGVLAAAYPIGDLTAIAGIVIAAVLYFVLFKLIKPKLGAKL
jgi:nucleobase:cation symporter-1, NCS1 family